jgi:hypothetical protein
MERSSLLQEEVEVAGVAALCTRCVTHPWIRVRAILVWMAAQAVLTAVADMVAQWITLGASEAVVEVSLEMGSEQWEARQP